jgi:hypothetical protein
VQGLGVILLHSLAHGIHIRQVVLRLGMTLVGGLAVPVSRLRHVLLHALPPVEQLGEPELGAGIALLRRLLVPAGRLQRIGVPRFAGFAQHGQVDLGIQYALLRRHQVPLPGDVGFPFGGLPFFMHDPQAEPGPAVTAIGAPFPGREGGFEFSIPVGLKCLKQFLVLNGGSGSTQGGAIH